MTAATQRAVLFADICDSTMIYQSVGDALALTLVNQLFGILNRKVAAQGGVVVKTLGDGMVCQFAGPDAAFRAACAMQAGAVEAKPGNHPRLAIKVGFTYGPVIAKTGDVFGDTVNVCARLLDIAGADQVVTTQPTVDALSPGLRLRCRKLYALKVKGRVGEVTVCDVMWRVDPDVTERDFSREAPASAVDWTLRLAYGGESLKVDPASEVTLGREQSNQVVVPSTRVSRLHARIFGREGHFVIVDQSSNGTYLLIDGNSREILLRREEARMGERGWIGLGASAATHGDHVLRYRIERRGG
jgi:adenylate cyclase